jgi:hypothetical protein
VGTKKKEDFFMKIWIGGGGGAMGYASHEMMTFQNHLVQFGGLCQNNLSQVSTEN